MADQRRLRNFLLTPSLYGVRVRGMRTYHFHTICNGRYHVATVEGTSPGEAAAFLRANLRDGETIVGWR